MSKIVSGRTEWERSQQRLTQTAAARQVPPVAESKILFVASQIPNLSRQLANRNQLDHIRISFLRLAAIDGHTDTNAALVTCLLLRACFNALPCNTSEEKKLLLGSWHDWKVTAGALQHILRVSHTRIHTQLLIVFPFTHYKILNPTASPTLLCRFPNSCIGISSVGSLDYFDSSMALRLDCSLSFNTQGRYHRQFADGTGSSGSQVPPDHFLQQGAYGAAYRPCG